MIKKTRKISFPILAAMFGAILGALSAQFVWTLLAVAGLLAFARITQNLRVVFRHPNIAEDRATRVGIDDAPLLAVDESSDSLEKWEEDIRFSPAYKGTPGNIWNGPIWTSDD
jgi:hypothetical protein